VPGAVLSAPGAHASGPGVVSVKPGEPAALPGPGPVVGATPPSVIAFRERADALARRTTTHRRGRVSADNAQDASAPDPDRDVRSQAAAARVEDMGEQKAGRFDAAAFKAAVKVAVEAMAPPANLEQAAEFKESGRARAATGMIGGLVDSGKRDSEQAIATSTASAPDPRGRQPKQPGVMVDDPAGRAAGTIGAASALPGPRPDAVIDLSAGNARVDGTMMARSLTVEQLADSNEPRFLAAVEARRAVAEQAVNGPVAYRRYEAGLLPAASAAVDAEEGPALAGLHGTRLGALRDARSAKVRTRDEDQRRRDGVNKSIIGIHESTKTAVEGLLKGLDTSVAQMFTEGEADARATFENYVDFKMREYKADRYGGFGGGALWLKDRFFDLPDEVNAFYRTGRQFYLFKLDRTIESIAGLVGVTLALAMFRIRIGRAQIQHLLRTLPGDLLALGVATADRLDSRFDVLTSDVEGAKDRLVDSVARAYTDSTGKLDARVTELQEENKGLVSKAVDFVEEVGGAIADLGRLLGRVLRKAASVIGDILAHPIRFVENLIAAVGAGLDLFAGRIGRHLQDALLDLLFGEIGRSGITLPSALDFAGIFDLVCQVLRITWADLRARLVDKLGMAAVLRMEQLVDVFQLLAEHGVGGLWQLAAQRLAELPDLVIGVLRRYIVERVIVEGIASIASLLTPASAFIKACQGIYRIVSFIVEKAKEIAAFVESVLDSMAAIAAGDVGDAAERIDAALAGALKLAVTFLAKLAHLDSLPARVQQVMASIRTPVRRAVDAIIDGAVSLYQRTLGAGRGRLAAGATASPPPRRAEPAPAPGHRPGQVATRPVPALEPADPQSIAMSVQLTMNHTDHTLSMRVIDGEPQVVLSSPRAEYLQTMATAAIRQEEHTTKPRAKLIKRLSKIKAELAELHFDWRAAHSRSDSEKRYQIGVRLGQIAANLRWIGRENHIEDLEHLGHASIYVEGNQLLPEYAGDVRGNFYPGGYLTAARAWRDSEKKRLRHPTDPTLFRDESVVPHEYHPMADATIDHKPRVVEHWNRTGNNTGHPARVAYYSDVAQAHLQLVARSNNSADGALAKALGHLYGPTVGPDFRGPRDE
jgi:hypothetical protein